MVRQRRRVKRIGQETVQYIRNIYKYYTAYRLQLDARAAQRMAKQRLDSKTKESEIVLNVSGGDHEPERGGYTRCLSHMAPRLDFRGEGNTGDFMNTNWAGLSWLARLLLLLLRAARASRDLRRTQQRTSMARPGSWFSSGAAMTRQ